MKAVNFTCPECGCNTLVAGYKSYEVWTVDTYDPSNGIVDGELIDLKTEELEDVGCEKCGFSIGYSFDEALDWLNKHSE